MDKKTPTRRLSSRGTYHGRRTTPDETHKTLRERMRVTRQKECWRCHRKMDPLELLRMYNHLGLRRITELKPVDSSGEIIDMETRL